MHYNNLPHDIYCLRFIYCTIYWFDGCYCRRVVPKNCFNTINTMTEMLQVNQNSKDNIIQIKIT